MPGQEPSLGADAREAVRQLRQVREAGREAVRHAREAAREAQRRAAEDAREAAREARAVQRETIRNIRAGGREMAAEGDTRSRIQQVALELFTENGYEATSLREIAERLGVTKAALYYHFKTKDEIIDSLVAKRIEAIDRLIEWAGGQPRGLETRRELLRRYSEMLYDQRNHSLMRFFERNQSSMTQHKAGAQMRERMLDLLDHITDRDTPLPDQIRSSLAIFALHSTFFTVRDPEISEEERREAALEVALDLVERGANARPGPDAPPRSRAPQDPDAAPAG